MRYDYAGCWQHTFLITCHHAVTLTWKCQNTVGEGYRSRYSQACRWQNRLSTLLKSELSEAILVKPHEGFSKTNLLLFLRIDFSLLSLKAQPPTDANTLSSTVHCAMKRWERGYVRCKLSLTNPRSWRRRIGVGELRTRMLEVYPP